MELTTLLKEMGIELTEEQTQKLLEASKKMPEDDAVAELKKQIEEKQSEIDKIIANKKENDRYYDNSSVTTAFFLMKNYSLQIMAEEKS